MRREQAIQYRDTLSEVLLSEADIAARRDFLRSERETSEYREARDIFKSEIRERINASREQSIVIEEEPGQLSKRQEDIIWANGIVEQFSAFASDKKGQGNARRFVRNNVKGLWQDPERLEVAASVWKAQGNDENSLYDVARSHVTKEVKSNWQRVTSDQLAQYVTSYAHVDDTKDFTGGILKAYFTGPQNQKERMGALYRFYEAKVDIADDKEALREAACISSFETDILPRGKKFQLDLVLLQLYGFATPKLRAEAGVCQALQLMFGRYAGLDVDAITKRNNAAYQSMQTEYTGEFLRADKRAVRAGHSQAVDAAFANANRGIISSFDDVSTLWSDSHRTSVTHDPIAGDGPESLYSTALFKKYRKKLEGTVVTDIQKQYAQKDLAKGGERNPIFVSINAPGKPYVLELAMPASLIDQKSGLLEKMLSNDAYEAALFSKVVSGESVSGNPILAKKMKADGKIVHYWYRIPVESESERHDVEALNAFGFPHVENDDLSAASKELVNGINLNRRRFLNQRGVRVPLDHPAFQNLGYKHIDFRKDKTDPEKTVATVKVNNVDISVKLDRNLQFDFEGKSADIGMIGESLRYTMLSLLQPILCEERVESPSGETIDVKKLFVSRVGHLRLLPEGQNMGEDQVKACLEKEGKDLYVLSEQRKEKLGTTRNTTYVRAVESEDTTLGPVVIPLGLNFMHPQQQAA